MHILQPTETEKDNSVICNLLRLRAFSKQGSENTEFLTELKKATAIQLFTT